MNINEALDEATGMVRFSQRGTQEWRDEVADTLRSHLATLEEASMANETVSLKEVGEGVYETGRTTVVNGKLFREVTIVRDEPDKVDHLTQAKDAVRAGQITDSLQVQYAQAHAAIAQAQATRELVEVMKGKVE